MGLKGKVANWILESFEKMDFIIYGKVFFYIPLNVQARTLLCGTEACISIIYLSS
jgi:hypothetical protein